MAACVLAGGYQVTSCAHRRREAIERLKKKGMEEVDAPAQNETSAISPSLLKGGC